MMRPIISRLENLNLGTIVGLTLPESKSPKLYRLVSTTEDMLAWLIQVRHIRGTFINLTLEIKTVSWDTKCFVIN